MPFSTVPFQVCSYPCHGPPPMSLSNCLFTLVYTGNLFSFMVVHATLQPLTVLGVYKGRQTFLFPNLNMWVVTVQSCSTYLCAIFMYCGCSFCRPWGGTQQYSCLHATLRWLSLWDECASRCVCVCPGAAER